MTVEKETIPLFDRELTLTDAQGLLSEYGDEFLEQVVRELNHAVIESGTGSPENVVTANPRKLYMDESGTAGNILYVKKTGTGKTGWILV